MGWETAGKFNSECECRSSIQSLVVGALWGVVDVLGLEFYVEHVVVAGVFCYSSWGKGGRLVCGEYIS